MTVETVLLNNIDLMVGSNIARLRLQCGLSLDQVASLTGVPAADIDAFEQGTQRAPATLLFKLANALEQPIAEFFSCGDARF